MRNILVKWFLPLLFVAYWSGISLFTHSHVLNGEIITHSHPLKGAHEHTKADLETLFYLSTATVAPDSILPPSIDLTLLILLELCLFASVVARACFFFGHRACLRAPPAAL